GFAFSLWAEDLRDRRQQRRDREARAEQQRAEREQRQEAREQRRRDFQRATLLELQEAMMDLARSYGQLHSHDVLTSRKAGEWTRSLSGEEADLKALAAVRATVTLMVR